MNSKFFIFNERCLYGLEARAGIEPASKGFADPLPLIENPNGSNRLDGSGCHSAHQPSPSQIAGWTF